MLSYLSSLTFSPDLIVTGRTMDELRDNPGTFLDSVDDDTLVSLAGLIPEQAAVVRAVEEFRNAQANPKRDPRNRSRDCVAGSSDAVVIFVCARSALERLVGADIWRVVYVFREAPTLEDHFTATEADDIFRFGQYLVRLKWPCIRQKLNEAVHGAAEFEKRLC
jgi:hypothetical protein